jgi:hypothetical protein
MTVRLTPTESDPPPQAVLPSPSPTVVRVTASGVNLPDDGGAVVGDTGAAPSGVDPTRRPATGSSATDRPAGGISVSGASVGGSPDPAVHGPESPAVAESRRALREARRQRRRAMWLCGAVVALCLALTIVVVTLARYRPLGSSSALSAPAAVPSATVPSPAPAPTVDRSTSPAAPFRGAPAPEGGTP